MSSSAALGTGPRCPKSHRSSLIDCQQEEHKSVFFSHIFLEHHSGSNPARTSRVGMPKYQRSPKSEVMAFVSLSMDDTTQGGWPGFKEEAAK